MPQDSAQDKTEKPTPKRRRKTREQGQVAKSQELNSVAVLLAGLGALYFLGGMVYGNLSDLMRHVLGSLGQSHFNHDMFHDFSGTVWRHFLDTVLPLWGIVFVAAVLINLAQVGFMLAPKRLKPDFKRMNPMKGIKRWFSMRTVVDIFKNLGKLAVVAFTAYYTIREEWDFLPNLGGMEIMQIVLYVVGVCFTIFFRCVLAMTVLAVLDWAYTKYEFEKNLKMTKQEVKDEFKQAEGDPQVKSRIRSMQRERAKARMMSSVPEADVVVTNPTHLAVALVYKAEEMNAPKVLAKGANKVAERIKEEARKAGVKVVEDKPLAQALFKAVEVGDYIPAELFETVATILAHVYREKNRHHSILNPAG